MWAYLKSCDTWERCELPQEVIQALDVALRYRPMNQYTPCNRSFFSSLKPYIISDLLELWYGHNQSLLLGRDGNATLNIDMANKAFVKQMPVVKLMKIILNKDEKCMDLCHWNDKQFRDAENFIKGKLIQYGSGGQLPDGSYKKQHRFIAVKIVKTDADTFTFPMNDKMISIREHFLEKEVSIKHPKWPVVHIGNKNMTNYVPI
ncbi:Protein argonaute 1, partial [Orchesella cincta]